MSPSDKVVAMSFGTTIELYRISDEGPETLTPARKVNVSGPGPGTSPESQILRFSANEVVSVLSLYLNFTCNIYLDAHDPEENFIVRRSGGASLQIDNVRRNHCGS